VTSNARNTAPAWRLRLLCALVLAAILTAGLWPFRRYKNQVSWAHDRNGIRFGGRAIVYTPGLPPRSGPAETDSCAVEIWLQPEAAPEMGVLAGFASAGYSFSLFQERFALGLHLHNHALGGPHYSRRVKDVFRPGETVLIAISSNGKTTNVFVDGVLTQSIDFPLVARNLHGEFQSRDWEGQLFGLAIYGRELSPLDVSRHREAWTSDGRAEPLPGADALAVYLFDERGGRIVHDKTSLGADLYIPERYTDPHRVLLKAEPPHLSGWRDILMNIAGFVPLGFLFYAYFSSGRSLPFPALVTVLTGFSISLGIEVSQSFLPDRNSDLLDIVTNTLGTVAGVLLCRIPRIYSGLARLGLLGPSARIVPQASDPRPRSATMET
jgi:VanZ family protein